jgi:dTDP-4-amino-4,6-dideoxygalactose transaminase
MMNIPLSSPDLTHEERACVMDVLLGRELSLGPRLPAFERALRDLTGARHAIAVNSGTSALHLCIKAAGIGAGDEVITTPFSFVASANCALFEQGVPVFVDIDRDTWNLDVSRIEGAITPRTKAILPVHVFGRPCPMEPILEIARRHNLAVIEDSCEAIGGTSSGRPVGTFGQTGVFAFYPNKQITTGEGGAIVTNDDEAARLCRSWRNQGRGESGAWLQHERLGYNYRLSDLNCALGTVQVSRLPGILAARASVAARYHEALAALAPDVVRPLPAEPGAEISWFVYVVRLSDRFSAADRNQVVEFLRSRGIGCNTYFSPIHLQPFYREMFGHRPGDFPVTEHIAERTVALPFFNHLKDEEIQTVCNRLADAISALSRRKRAVA